MNAVVHKFGGVALANAEAIRHAVQIVAKSRTRGVAVVASAMSGVTDALLDIAAAAARSEGGAAKKGIIALRKRHVAAATELATDPTQAKELVALIDRELADLAQIAQQLV